MLVSGLRLAAAAGVLGLASLSLAQEAKIVIEHKDSEEGKPFAFKKVPPPSSADLATKAKFLIVAGDEDPNGGGVAKLHDGRGPAEEDQPAENFFFNAGSPGGQLLVDFQQPAVITGINTYSWHPGSRSPQVYKLYCNTNTHDSIPVKKTEGPNLAASGWKLLAAVDSRTNGVAPGGQVGVAVSLAGPPLNTRYLLFDISATEKDDYFGNTFYSEIDVLGTNMQAAAGGSSNAAAIVADEYKIEGTPYSFSIDASASPELAGWSREKVAPMAREWYPKLVAMLASDGFEAPHRFTIKFDPEMSGVANTSRGTKILCASRWFGKNLKGEALGAIFHEIVHVVQQYGSRPQGSARPPGWLVEGIPDYIRWYIFEPEAHGADIRPSNIERAKYDGKYRITANFLNWVTTTYKQDGEKPLVTVVNAALRQGTYEDALWKRLTGHSIEELDVEWRDRLKADAEKKAAKKLVSAKAVGTGPRRAT
jgi:hypothetical protein